MWNKAKGILIPSTINTKLIPIDTIIKNGNKLLLNKNESWVNGNDTDVLIPHQLYIITDEKIKVGEKCFHSNINEICIADEFMVENPDCKKIIATNNDKISINLGKEKWVAPTNKQFDQIYTRLCPYPQPTKEFIQQFVDVINALDITIDLISIDLFVEYESNLLYPMVQNNNEKLILNPDNTINIKLI